uniref:Nuclear pore complex NUP2/50/61 domain-containing protein n=1 Tax=Anopheles maculatus TaxID=74869 RepID=A0A182SB50_9DIPT
MAKRGPQSSLNHLNWNETDEPEEKGEFAKASDDVLKQRVIKKARRRVATDAADSTAPGAAASTSVFGAFKGFASTPLGKGGADKPDGAPTFSFLSTLGAAAKTNGNGTATVSSSGADSGVAGSTKPMFSFGTNQGTIGAAADASKKMFTFGTPNALKADSTEGAKNASSTSSGFGISSSKDNDKEGASKGLFSIGGSTATANPVSAGSTPNFSFGTVPKTTDSGSKPEKSFTFGFAGGNKDKAADTTPKATFSFGSIAAAKTDAGETEKKTIAFGSPIGSKDSSLSAASSTGMFNFGSNATKSDTNDAEKKPFGLGSSPAVAKSTFAFGSPATKTDSAETERKGFTFGSSPAASKESAAAVPAKGIFSFGSPAAKPAAAADTPDKPTVTFGSPAAGAKDTSATPKGTFSFGSLPPKANADEAPDKKATGFSFGSVASSGAQSSPKATTFSFGSLQPSKSDAVGFGAAPSSPTKKPSEPEKKTFSFGIPPGANVTVDKSKATFGTPKENSEDTIKKMFSFAPSAPKSDSSSKTDEEKKTVSFPVTTTTSKLVVPAPSATTTPGTQTTDMKANVIALNHAFVAWITQKCKENAFCNFSPVFKSYEKHFAKFKEMEQNGTEKSLTNSSSSTMEAVTKLTSTTAQPSKADFPTVTATKPLETKPNDPVAKEPEKAKEKTGFFFGTSAPKETSAMKTFAPAPAAGGFTFGSGKPLTFGGFSSSTTANPATTSNNSSTAVSTTSPSFFAGASTFASKSLTPGGFTFGSGIVKPPVPDSSAAAANKDAGEAAEADEDEPPKVEFTPVEEKDSLYSKRCKLYFKVDGSYSDRGVSTLHIKKVDGKVQLLVRADTSLATFCSTSS